MVVGAFVPKVAHHCTTKIGQLNSRSVATVGPIKLWQHLIAQAILPPFEFDLLPSERK